MVWNGSQISVFGAKNEVVSFNLVLETGAQAAASVSVSLASLAGPNGATISSKSVTGDGVFDWTGRNIELFYIRYLPIKGLSVLSYEAYYDERHAVHGPAPGLAAAPGLIARITTNTTPTLRCPLN